MTAAVPTAQRCTAKSKQAGRQCGNKAIPGGTVCRIHGGAAKQVQRKARLRLAQMVDPALTILARELVNPNSRPADRLRAVENVLDRAGFPRGQEIRGADDARELLTARLIAWRDSLIEGEAPGVVQDDQDDDLDQDRQLLAE